MVDKIDNMQKYGNYKDQFGRLSKAIRNGYHLEAIFIEYAIIEDRTKSILQIAGKYEAYLKKRGKSKESLESKVKYIQGFAAEKKSILHKYFGDQLLDKVLEWKELRNPLIHALLDQSLTSEKLDEVANAGYELSRKLCDRVTNYRRYLERHSENK